MISHYSGDGKGDAKMHASSSKGDDEKGKGGVDIDNLGLDKKKEKENVFRSSGKNEPLPSPLMVVMWDSMASCFSSNEEVPN